MTERTTLNDHSDLARRLLNDVEAFVDEIGSRSCTSHLEAITTDGKFLKGAKLSQEPERFIEDYLIFPVLRTLGHSVLPRPIQYAPRWNHGRGIPDFCLTSIPVSVAKENDLRLFGEAKPPNKLEYAREDVRDYLQKDLDFHAVAVLTDGLNWELWTRPRNEPLSDAYDADAMASLRDVLSVVKARNLECESYHAHYAREILGSEKFAKFTASNIRDICESY